MLHENDHIVINATVITSERSEQSFCEQSYMDRHVDIQKALKPFQNIRNI